MMIVIWLRWDKRMIGVVFYLGAISTLNCGPPLLRLAMLLLQLVLHTVILIFETCSFDTHSTKKYIISLLIYSFLNNLLVFLKQQNLNHFKLINKHNIENATILFVLQ